MYATFKNLVWKEERRERFNEQKIEIRIDRPMRKKRRGKRGKRMKRAETSNEVN